MYVIGGDQWTVNYNLAVISNLNKAIIQRIKSYHIRRHEINQLAKQEPIDSSVIDTYRLVLDGLEYRLQTLWGFPLDNRFHPHQRIGV